MSSVRSRVWISAAQVLLTCAVVAVIVWQWGFSPFRDALAALPLWSVFAAVVLGGVGVSVQGLRWRLVARHLGIQVSRRSAVARCWQAAFLNSVLPGGLAGDALRAVDDSSDSDREQKGQALAGSTAAVAAERIAGTVVVLVAAAVVLLFVSWLPAVLFLAAAGLLGAVAWRWLRKLSGGDLCAVAVFSVLGWCAFLGLYALAAGAVGSGFSFVETVSMGSVTLAGMSLPVGVGGWGPREAAATWAAMLFGHSAHLSVTVSIAYGVLALASTAPGAVLAVVRLVQRARG